MGKINVVQKSRKEHKCSKCGATIAVGQKYYRGELNFAKPIIRCDKCKLESWEVTTSDYQKSVGEIVYKWRENFGVEEETAEQLSDELECIRDDLQDRLDNMPEGLQEGDIGQLLQERIDNVESCIDDLTSIDIDTIKSEVVSGINSREELISIPEDGDSDDYDTIFDANESLQEEMTRYFTDLLSSAIDDALSYLEV